MNLIDVNKEFATNEQCLAYLEALRWPDGVCCTECGAGRISRITRHSETKNKRTKLYQCLACKAQFSGTSGTLFNDSHLPLNKWFLAIALICNAKKGLSAKQMQRDLGVTYRTAWYLCHRIRKAMEEGELPKMTGIVEADETYVGGKYDKRCKRGPWEKQPVMGIVQRASAEGEVAKVEAYKIPTPSKAILVGKIKERVDTDAEVVVTDELAAYDSVIKTHHHETVNHSKLEWVRGNFHTNTVENFWSLFKRGVIGQFHRMSIKHLDRYIAEFTYRHNGRKLDLFTLVLARLVGEKALPMPYRKLVASSNSARLS